jgi:intracellular sulfur oxidation DsrE/DsrF family protein
MNRPKDLLDDVRLHAWADGLLSEDEAREFVREVGDEATVMTAAARLRRTKDLVRFAFADEAPPPLSQPAPRRRARGWLAVAASALLLLGAGYLTGWLANERLGEPGWVRLASTEADPGRLVLHLTSNDHELTLAALDRAESLLRSRAGEGLKLELVVNGSGLDLLRTDTSPALDRLRSLVATHPELRLVACQSTLRQLRRQGVQVTLIDEAELTDSAVQHIIGRLQNGWTYVKL